MSRAERTTFQPVEIATSGQSEARLVFFDSKLVAVISLLDDEHDEFALLWFADAAFNGLESMLHQIFSSLDDVANWIEQRLAH